jgi:hypothetical protein
VRLGESGSGYVSSARAQVLCESSIRLLEFARVRMGLRESVMRLRESW